MEQLLCYNMIHYTLNKTSMSHLGHNTEIFTKLHSVQQSNKSSEGGSKALYVNQRNYYDVPCSVLEIRLNFHGKSKLQWLTTTEKSMNWNFREKIHPSSYIENSNRYIYMYIYIYTYIFS